MLAKYRSESRYLIDDARRNCGLGGCDGVIDIEMMPVCQSIFRANKFDKVENIIISK